MVIMLYGKPEGTHFRYHVPTNPKTQEGATQRKKTLDGCAFCGDAQVGQLVKYDQKTGLLRVRKNVALTAGCPQCGGSIGETIKDANKVPSL